MSQINFTKMHGAGNDFIVIDCHQTPNAKQLSPNQLRALANRRFGIGADQILMVEAAQTSDADFRYRIFNADGEEVEHCGNGARCFAKFVYNKGLIKHKTIRAEVMHGIVVMTINDNDNVRVAVSTPSFTPYDIPFLSEGLVSYEYQQCSIWCIPFSSFSHNSNEIKVFKEKNRVDLKSLNNETLLTHSLNEKPLSDLNHTIDFAVTNLGNPHISILCKDIMQANIASLSDLLAKQTYFPAGINVGFFEILDSNTINCRVYERGAGETLACGTGACAAAITGMKLGLLNSKVSVLMPGGNLIVEWESESSPLAAVYLTGPAVEVYSGQIDLSALA